MQSLERILSSYEAAVESMADEIAADPSSKSGLEKLRTLTGGLEIALKAKIAWDKAELEAAKNLGSDAKLEALESFLVALARQGKESSTKVEELCQRVLSTLKR